MRLNAGERIGRFVCGERNSEDRFRRTNPRGPGCPGLGARAQRGMWGMVPEGAQSRRRADDPKYPLKETPSVAYIQRTEWNARDSDVTVLFSILPALSGGSKKTMEFARKHKKPWLHLCAGETEAGSGMPEIARASNTGCAAIALQADLYLYEFA